MSGLPKSVWAVADRDADQLIDEFYKTDRKRAEREANEYDRLHPSWKPHRAVRYDLADPERDKQEAEALDLVLDARRPWLSSDWPSPEATKAREILASLRDRLKGGAQ